MFGLKHSSNPDWPLDLLDNLHLTFARRYLGKLLANARIVRWLSLYRPEYLTEFQRIAEIDSLGGIATPSAE